MNLLDLFRKSRLRTPTANGNRPSTTYEDSVVKARNVRFPPNISPGANFDQYVSEETGAVPGSPAPVQVTYYMVAENDDFLITENDNNLIIDQEIV